MRLIYAACILCWLLLSGLLALSIASRAMMAAEQQFTFRAHQLSEEVSQRLLGMEAVLDIYSAFSGLDQKLDHAREQQYIRQLLRRYPHISALGHIERVALPQLPGFAARMRQIYGHPMPLHSMKPGEPLPKQDEYLALVLLEPLPSTLSQLVGADLSHQYGLMTALRQSEENDRMALSPAMRLSDGSTGYLLVHSEGGGQLQLSMESLRPAHFSILLLRAQALLPENLQLPAGMTLTLSRSGDEQHGARWPGRPVPPGWLERALFPQLGQELLVGGESHPLRMKLQWQLGWSQIGPFEWGAFLLLSLLLLLTMGGVAFGYGRISRSRRQRENQLFYLANHDRLTGLANRNLFYDRLQHAMSRVDRSGKRLALLFLDLDRFKPVNDTYGHVAGDKVLQQIALRIQQVLRVEDTVARLGGDEFVVLIEDVESHRQTDRVVLRLKSAIQRPYLVDGQEIRIGVSIGNAYYPEDGRLIDELLEVADRKMYGDKREPEPAEEAV